MNAECNGASPHALMGANFVSSPPLYHQGRHPDPKLSQVIEKEWRHWMEFFVGSNDRLGPNGRCDCHRTYSRIVGSKTVENRYFWLPNGALNLSFINVLGLQLPVVGRWAPCAQLYASLRRHRLVLISSYVMTVSKCSYLSSPRFQDHTYMQAA